MYPPETPREQIAAVQVMFFAKWLGMLLQPTFVTGKCHEVGSTEGVQRTPMLFVCR